MGNYRRERVVNGIGRLRPGRVNDVLVDVLESQEELTDMERAKVLEMVARAERLNADVLALRAELDGGRERAG